MIKPRGLDHIVLTVASIEQSIRFYCDVLGFEEVTFGGGRKALQAGEQKINLHPAGNELLPHADRPTPGSGDICIIYDADLADIEARIRTAGVKIEQGPVPRTGAMGAICSLYIRDPDNNLVELSVYQ